MTLKAVWPILPALVFAELVLVFWSVLVRSERSLTASLLGSVVPDGAPT